MNRKVVIWLKRQQVVSLGQVLSIYTNL